MRQFRLSNWLFSIFAVLVLADRLPAQQASPVSFRVYTEPAGARFSVDGTVYTSSATFTWPVGSKHLVTFLQDQQPNVILPPGSPTLQLAQFTPDAAIMYQFSGWVDNAGLLGATTDVSQWVTADPGITWLKASVSVNYRVLLNFFDNPPATLPPSCSTPSTTPPDSFRVGLVFVGGQCYWNNAILYFPAGTSLLLNAVPYPGFVFLGWAGLGSSNSYLQSWVLNGPITIVPLFGPGKRVRLETNPLGLPVLVDRTAAPTLSVDAGFGSCPQNQSLPIQVPASFTPLCLGDFDFAPDSQHLIAAQSPQTDILGKSWIFDSWSSTSGQAGHDQNSIYKTDEQTAVPDRVTVNFVPGVKASFVTVPSGLKLSIDGRTNWPAYNFVWGLNSTHDVIAPPQQSDSTGRQFTFQGWSNSGSASQTITMDQSAADAGFRLIATYSGLSRVIVQTSPAGQHVQIDGADCIAPCTVDRQNGASIRLTAPTSIQVSDQIRMDLTSWSDGGAADHPFLLAADLQTVTANYATSYRLSTASDPANGALLNADPPSPDGFYPSGTTVAVSANNNPGFKFRRWAGDLTGTYASGFLALTGPRSVTALMDRAPYIAPAGVQNAAAATSDGTVAPGSLIAITGESLAPDTVQGRANPLAQTLDNLTVTLGNQLLSLVSVSPQQIVAQLPSNLAEGDYTLQVHSQGQPDVSGSFTVARNAPGLFSSTVDGQSFLVANHADGTPVTPASPAVRGETITILGAGFGPYASPVIDGFYPQAPAPALVDPVNVLAGDQLLQPVWSGAAGGQTGMVAIQLLIGDPLPSATNVTLQMRVNGKLTNTVLLPLQ